MFVFSTSKPQHIYTIATFGPKAPLEKATFCAALGEIVDISSLTRIGRCGEDLSIFPSSACHCVRLMRDALLDLTTNTTLDKKLGKTAAISTAYSCLLGQYSQITPSRWCESGAVDARSVVHGLNCGR